MKIAIINQPLANRGDEAAHKAFMRCLARKFPNYKFDVLFLNEKYDRILPFDVKMDNVSYINIHGFGKGYGKAFMLAAFLGNMSLATIHPLNNRYKKIISEYDYVICAPGGICMGGFMKWEHIGRILIAKKAGKKVLYWGRSIGPFSDEDFKHKVFKKFSIKVLNCLDFISLRDSKSVEIAKELGVSCVEMIDSAFMGREKVLIPENIKNILGESKYIVFVPNQLTWHYKYRKYNQNQIDSFFIKIVELIIKQHPSYKIIMLPQTYKSVIRDYDYFYSLEGKCNNRNIITLGEDLDSDVQQEIISNSELVIGARYHSIIFAINNSVPFISLCYEHKMSGILEKIGLLDRMVDIQEIFENKDNQNKCLGMIENQIASIREIDCKEQIDSIMNTAYCALYNQLM